MNRIDPDQVRKCVLEILDVAPGPLTTAQLRAHLAEHAGIEAVNEVVYRNLVVLERRGCLRRLRPGGRHVAWEPVASATKGTTS